MEKYEKGVQWIKELLYETKLTPDRLKITAAKMVNDVAQFKRQGNKIVNDLMEGLIYNKGKKFKELCNTYAFIHIHNRVIANNNYIFYFQRAILVYLTCYGNRNFLIMFWNAYVMKQTRKKLFQKLNLLEKC